ncbi:MAG: penicillin acylase family protein [Pseudomonadota bacterium]
MRVGLKVLSSIAIILLTGVAIASLVMPKLNDRQTKGEIALPGLQAPVKVIRDAHATPYIYADNLKDALRAQGFVAGQDRLFQLETAKRAATGRLAEIFGAGDGDVILNLDREARTIGFSRLAARHAAMLSAEEHDATTAYLEGLNTYISTRAKTHPLEFGLAGFTPEAWTETDLLSVMYYLGWASSANFDAELIAQQVINEVGHEKFNEIAPLVINPDDQAPLGAKRRASSEMQPRFAGATAAPGKWAIGGWRRQGYGGSNNWAVSGEKAGERSAIVTNDPHLDSRTLPGPWHPVGLITPTLRVVGVSVGLPGIAVGRNEHIAFGVTNAYSDAVDLYVETVDPSDSDRYLEGDQSFPFEEITETIRIKDDTIDGGFREEQLVVKYTHRGPVISDSKQQLEGDAVLTMRWASAEYMEQDIGLVSLMRSQTIEEALSSIEAIRAISLNFIVGDVNGRIARRASGAAPIRLRGDGMTPFPVVDGIDNWGGPIPPEHMPGEVDPARGWTGTANHMTAPADYPYVYTTYASPSYRYRRMQELFASQKVTADAVWAAQYDTLNVFARDLAPIFSSALAEADNQDLRAVGKILANWDYHDDQDGIETTLFQEIVRQLAQLTFEDELGSEATAAYLSNWYVWQERFDAMVQGGTSPWFDDIRTSGKEDLSAMIRRAGVAAIDRLTDAYGANRSEWRWGAVNQMRFRGPLRRDGFIGRLTGNRNAEMSGSGETLMRALYPYHSPFDTQWSASLRMTADLNDPDKVRAVLPGGVVGRTFHPNLADQTADWENKNAVTYWWFSDEAIKSNARSTLLLTSAE